MEDMKLVPVVLQLKEELPEIVDGKTTGNTVWVASNGRGYVNVEEMKQFDEVFIYTKDGQFTARKPSISFLPSRSYFLNFLNYIIY